jgi:hypothetical protein
VVEHYDDRSAQSHPAAIPRQHATSDAPVPMGDEHFVAFLNFSVFNCSVT